jgi:hypothetical protein
MVADRSAIRHGKIVRFDQDDWIEQRSRANFASALSIGIVTVVAPLFILQPALGAEIASTKTPKPVFNSIKSLAPHTVFGLGLYLAAVATALIPAPRAGLRAHAQKILMPRRVKGSQAPICILGSFERRK